MEESQLPSMGTPTPSASLLTRLTNVFVAPGEVFNEIKSRPVQPANWIVPLVLAIIAGVAYSLVVFSQPNVVQQMKDSQEKKFQEMAVSGKMPQQQIDRMREATDKFVSPAFLKIVGCVGTVVGNAGQLFLIALVLWAIGKRAFHANFNYMQSVEVVGLSMMITVLGAIVALFLAVIYSNVLATPGPVLFFSHLDSADKMHRALSALNLTSIWYVGVLSIGLARLSGVNFLKAAAWLYGIWIVVSFGPIVAFGGK